MFSRKTNSGRSITKTWHIWQKDPKTWLDPSVHIQGHMWDPELRRLASPRSAQKIQKKLLFVTPARNSSLVPRGELARRIRWGHGTERIGPGFLPCSSILTPRSRQQLSAPGPGSWWNPGVVTRCGMLDCQTGGKRASVKEAGADGGGEGGVEACQGPHGDRARGSWE